MFFDVQCLSMVLRTKPRLSMKMRQTQVDEVRALNICSPVFKAKFPAAQSSESVAPAGPVKGLSDFKWLIHFHLVDPEAPDAFFYTKNSI